MRQLTFFLLLVTVNAMASDDAPRIGLLYSAKESQSLTYQCESTSPDRLLCSFVQTSVRKKLPLGDVAGKLSNAKSEFDKMTSKNKEEFCVGVSDLADFVNGKKKPPDPAKYEAELSNPLLRENFTRSVQLMDSFCKAPTAANYMALARFMIEKDTKTCLVSSNKFEQRFRAMGETGGHRNWVVDSPPQGECGIVQLSRFEYEKSGTSGIGFWTYTARKAITNPNAETFFGAKCSRFDEAEYLYDWRSREIALGCDFIEFSVL